MVASWTRQIIQPTEKAKAVQMVEHPDVEEDAVDSCSDSDDGYIDSDDDYSD
jgi:hypothetical protein